MNKTQLRKEMSRVISGLSNSNKQIQSKELFEKLIRHKKYKEAKCLSIYLSTDNEIDTIPILRHALELEMKRCFIPYVRKSRSDVGTRMVMVELISMADYERLPFNNYGIKEPIETQEKPLTGNGDSLDLIIVPGVAFDQNGHRLGHGKGYYDEFLIDWSRRNGKSAYTIGIGFKEQIVKHTHSVTGHDYILDEIMTP